MRFVDLYNTICSGAAPAHERHYLQFDGVGDYAVADAVFGGISGDYTIAIKVAGKITSGRATAAYYASGGPSGSATAQQMRDTATSVASFANTLMQGIDTGGSATYVVTFYDVPSAGAKVIATKRTAANAAYLRVVATTGVEATSDDLSATHEIPDHIAVGCRVDDSLTPNANRYGAIQFIGLVLASVEVPDAELTAWLNDDTAVGNITGIDHYWCASDISGATIPARVGTVALALTGPTSSDLVAWSP